MLPTMLLLKEPACCRPVRAKQQQRQPEPLSHLADNMSEERKAAMAAYGAELISVPAGRMEVARDLALQMQAEGRGIVLDQVRLLPLNAHAFFS